MGVRRLHYHNAADFRAFQIRASTFQYTEWRPDQKPRMLRPKQSPCCWSTTKRRRSRFHAPVLLLIWCFASCQAISAQRQIGNLWIVLARHTSIYLTYKRKICIHWREAPPWAKLSMRIARTYSEVLRTNLHKTKIYSSKRRKVVVV